MASTPGSGSSDGPYGTVQIPCTDGFQRHRAVTLWANPAYGDSGQVVVVVPAGEAARMSPEEAGVLAGQLVVHADRVEKQAAKRRRQAVQQAKAKVLDFPARQAGVSS